MRASQLLPLLPLDMLPAGSDRKFEENGHRFGQNAGTLFLFGSVLPHPESWTPPPKFLTWGCMHWVLVTLKEECASQLPFSWRLTCHCLSSRGTKRHYEDTPWRTIKWLFFPLATTDDHRNYQQDLGKSTGGSQCKHLLMNRYCRSLCILSMQKVTYTSLSSQIT